MDCGDTSMEPEVVMTMEADTAHKFWLGKVNVTVALARGQMKAKGPVAKILKLVPLVKPVFPRYRKMLEDAGPAGPARGVSTEPSALDARQMAGFKDFYQYVDHTRVIAGRGLLESTGFEFMKEGASRVFVVTDEVIRGTGPGGQGRRPASRTAASRSRASSTVCRRTRPLTWSRSAPRPRRRRAPTPSSRSAAGP